MFPTSMAAVTIRDGQGPAEALELGHVDVPSAGPDQLLIRVRAAGINRPDLFQRMGLYPPPPGASNILGLEVAGEVVKPAGRFQLGDRVCALLGGGGYAEYAACDWRHVLPVPDGLSWIEAASLPETVFTVYANVFEDGLLAAGQTLLVHGANSGIGVTAIQMGKAAGATVIATARGPAKAAQAVALGADAAIDVLTQDFGDEVLQLGGADVVLDMMGGDYFAGNLRSLKPKGRIIFIAALAGPEITVPVFAMMQKHAVITGSTLRARNADEKARLAEKIEEKVWPWIKAGLVKPQISEVFELADAAKAHACLEAGRQFGKVILEIPE